MKKSATVCSSSSCSPVLERDKTAYVPCSPFHLPLSHHSKQGDLRMSCMSRSGSTSESLTSSIRHYFGIRSKTSKTVISRLRLRAEIIQQGGIEKVFRQTFSAMEEEKLLKACQCYLSTSAGPIAGLLFVTSERIAFCSLRSITISADDGRRIAIPYKVVIPLNKISRATSRENSQKPRERYIHIVTVDNFDFWFKAFVNHRKAFKSVHEAVGRWNAVSS